MDKKACAETRSSLIDVSGSRAALPPELRAHLETCPDCLGFESLLLSLAPAASPPDGGARADYRAVDLAFEKARLIEGQRQARLELAIFLAAASAYTCLFVLAGASGYGLFLLALEGLAVLALPFAGFYALNRKLKGAP
jgi:hypothetical protein